MSSTTIRRLGALATPLVTPRLSLTPLGPSDAPPRQRASASCPRLRSPHRSPADPLPQPLSHPFGRATAIGRETCAAGSAAGARPRGPREAAEAAVAGRGRVRGLEEEAVLARRVERPRSVIPVQCKRVTTRLEENVSVFNSATCPCFSFPLALCLFVEASRLAMSAPAKLPLAGIRVIEARLMPLFLRHPSHPTFATVCRSRSGSLRRQSVRHRLMRFLCADDA